MKFQKKRTMIYFFLLLIIAGAIFINHKLQPPTRLNPIFKSTEAKHRFYKAYDTAMLAWNTPYFAKDVNTSFGSTHINICGDENKPPLVLLSIMTFSSVSWYPNIRELSKHFKIYSIDIIGDHNRSEASRLLPDKKHFADWLFEVLNILKLDKVNIAGESYGGFITLSFALYHPEMVNKAILIAPAATLTDWKFPVKAFITVVKIFPTIIPSDYNAAFKIFSDYPEKVDIRVKGVLKSVYKEGIASQLITPQEFTENELRQVKTKTLVMIGEHEPNYDYNDALQRAEKFMPNVTGLMVPNAKHLVNIDQPEIVNKKMIEFLLSSK
ncbi:MAG: carboxylesterase [Mucilaginibacter sp.]|nr:carboxylesterase [Mucilaginibacter sp.]